MAEMYLALNKQTYQVPIKFPLNLINKLTATLAFNGTLILNYYIMFVKNMVRRRACRLPASLSHPPFATVVEILLALKKWDIFIFQKQFSLIRSE